MALRIEAARHLKGIIREPYCWPGGYERCAIMDDGGLVCWSCCKKEFRCIMHSTLHGFKDGWSLEGTYMAESDDWSCSHCGTGHSEWFGTDHSDDT